MTTSHDEKTTSENLSNSTKNVSSLRKTTPFIITLVVSVILSTLYTHINITKQNSQLVARSELMEKMQTKIELDNQALLDNIEDNFNKQILSVNKKVDSALQESGYKSNDWLMLKARYYLELASINFHWSNQTSSTLALLQEADRILATIEGKDLTDVRQIISKEQSLLKQISPVDTVGILSQLTSIDQVVSKLTPKKPMSFLVADKNTKSDLNTANSWRDQLKNSLAKLDTLIVIRHQDESTITELTPAYISILTETVHLNIQEAIWAVLEQNDDIYKMMLQHIIKTINRVFDVKDPEVIMLVKQINALEELSLTKPTTEIGDSLRLLNNLISHESTGESL